MAGKAAPNNMRNKKIKKERFCVGCLPLFKSAEDSPKGGHREDIAQRAMTKTGEKKLKKSARKAEN